MQIKTQTLSSTGQPAPTSLSGSEATLMAGSLKQIAMALPVDDVARYERVGNDLVLMLKSGEQIRLVDFFRADADGEPELVLLENADGCPVEIMFADDEVGVLQPLISDGLCSIEEAGVLFPALWVYGGIATAAAVYSLVADSSNGNGNAPPALRITASIAGDDVVNAAEDNSVIASGTTTNIPDGQTVTVAFTDANGATVTATTTVKGNSWSIAGADISGLLSGVIKVTATVTDAAGDQVTDSKNIRLDNGNNPADPLPTIAITMPVSGDDLVNASEDNAVVVSGTTTDVEDGQTVTVTFTDSLGATVTATAIVNGNAWSLSGSDISGLLSGAITVDAVVSDMAGNPANDGHAIRLDNGNNPADPLPTIAITTPVSGDDLVNAAEDNALVVSGTTTDVEDGQIVTVTFTDANGASVTATATVNGNAWSLSGSDISGLLSGAITVDAVVSDMAGNPANDGHAIRLDNGNNPADPLPTIAITIPVSGDDLVNAAEDNALVVSGTTTDVEDGQTVTVTFTDDNGATVTATTTVTGNAWSLSGSDISGLLSGPITVDAVVSDMAGNPASDGHAIRLDNGNNPADPLPTIAITTPVSGDDLVNAAEDNALVVSGTTTDVEDGQTVTVTFTDDNGATVTATTTVTGNAWSLSGSDISGLLSGAITVDAVVSDMAGNPANDGHAIRLDNGNNPADPLPTIAITTPVSGDDLVNAAEDNALVVSGTTTDVEDGQIVTVTFTDANGASVTATATVNGNAWSLSGSDISGLLSGAITVDAVVSDMAGNPANDGHAIRLDNGNNPADPLPTIAITIPVSGDDLVNAAEDNALVVSGTTTDVEDGQTVTVTFTDSLGATVTATAIVNGNAWSLSGSDISGLLSGPITVDAVVSDMAGNPASDGHAIRLDNGNNPADPLPTIAITTPVAGDDLVNAAEDNALVVSGTTTDVEDGQTVTVTFTDDNGATVTATTTVTGNTWSLSGSDISGLLSGPITVDAVVSDMAGNPASDGHAIRLDNGNNPADPLPTIAITTPVAGDDLVNAAEDNALVVSGTTTDVEDGQTVTVTFTDDNGATVTATTTVTGNAWSLSGSDISGLLSGAITVDAVVSDMAGNPASDGHAIRLDNGNNPADPLPTIAITMPVSGDDLVNAAEDNALVVSGTTTDVEDGQTVTVTFTDDNGATVTATTTVTGNAWSLSGSDISGLLSGAITVDAVVSDMAGNPASDGHAIRLDNGNNPADPLPTIAITMPVSGDDLVNAAEDNALVVSGTTTDVEDGQTVTVTFTDDNGATVTATTTVTGNAWSLSGSDISGLLSGPITVDAVVSDMAGNPANDGHAIRLDNGNNPADPLPTIAITTPVSGDNLVNAAEDNALVVSGTATDVEDGQTVTVTFTDSLGATVTATTTVTGNAWSLGGADISGLANGAITVQANVADAAGNAAPTSSAPITLDNAAPAIAPDITGIDVDSGTNSTDGITNDTTPTFRGNAAEPSATINLEVRDSSNAVIWTGTTTADAAGIWTAPYGGTALQDGSYTVTATQTDQAGNGPSPADTYAFTIDATAAPITIEGISNDPDRNSTTSSASTIVSGLTGPGQMVEVSVDGGTPVMIIADANGVWTHNVDLSAVAVGGTVTVTAATTDIAGNTSPVATRIITKEAVVSSVLDLTNLTPTQGLVIQGDAAGDQAGYSVSSAGDVNGDGIDDFIVGAVFGNDGGSLAGEAYVVFGKSGGGWGSMVGGRQVLDLTNLAPADGFIVQGVTASLAGSSVSAAGDLNGDGIGDFIVGALSLDDVATNAGGAYVIFGKDRDVGQDWNLTLDPNGRQVLDIASLTPSDGFIVRGGATNDFIGLSVSSAGDINGDGITDFIVGAPNGDDGGTNAGEAYVIFGKSGGGWGTTVGGRQVLDLNSLAPTDGFIVQGDAAGDQTGISVSAAGDINGDGIGDFLVGAPFGDDGSVDAGKAYVVFGKAGATGTSWGTTVGGRQVLDLTSLAPADGFIVQGDAGGDNAGYSVSSAGDVNGDGISDFIVGAVGNDDGGFDAAGQAYVIFGKDQGAGQDWSLGNDGNGRRTLDLTTLTPADGFIIQGEEAADQAGWSISSAGDFNGDGVADLIVGAIRGGSTANEGAAYVIFGKAGATGTSWGTAVGGRQVLDLTGLSPSDGFIIQGDSGGDEAGRSVSSAGDINGDGYDDLIVGAPTGDDGGTDAGQAYIIYGHANAGTQTGTTGEDWLAGTDGADMLIGLGGADVLLGYGGDDRITVADAGFREVNGGTGSDTLVLSGSGITLDFTQFNADKVKGIEAIDLTGTGNNTLVVTAQDVLDMSDTDILRIDSDAGDTVQAIGFTDTGDLVINGVTYDVYTSGGATLHIEQGTTVLP